MMRGSLTFSMDSLSAARRICALVLLISLTMSLCPPRGAAQPNPQSVAYALDQILTYFTCPPKTKIKIAPASQGLVAVTMIIPASDGHKESTINFYTPLHRLFFEMADTCESVLADRAKSHVAARGRTALSLTIETKGAADAAFADLTGDTIVDVAIANQDANTVSILRGKPDGTFEFLSDVPSGVAPIRIIAGDFNNDGKIDLVTVNAGNGISGNLSLLIGHGNGTFDPPITIVAGTQPLDVAAAKLDADDNLDLAVAAGAAGVVVLLGNGNGTFQAPIVVQTSDFPGSIVAVDLNLDGKMDVVTNGSILIGNGNGTFKAPAPYAPNGLSPTLVRAGDVNRDGKPDIVTATSLANVVSVQLGNGDGTVGTARHCIVSHANELQIVDGDGDGILDLLASADDGLSLILGRGDGTFQGMAAYPSAANISNRIGALATAVADLNDDGIPDIVVANGGTPFNGQPDAIILPGTGLGRFGSPVSLPNQDGSWVVAGDWNGDGKADLAFTIEGRPSTGTPARLAIVQRTGSFTFAAPTFHNLPDTKDAPSFLLATSLSGPGTPTDLVVANIGAALVSVFKNNGTGVFTPQPTVPVGVAPRWIAAGDLDGDGKQDLVVANGGDFGALNGSLSVLFGSGNGAFQPGPSLLAGTSPDSVVIADLDGDGKLDIGAIVEAPLFTWSIRVLRGNGNGTFAAPQIIPLTQTLVTGLSAVDFNRDGILDLVATVDGTQIAILKGKGDGTFEAPVVFPSVGGRHIPIDLDRDSRPDLVGASGVGVVGVMLNRSSTSLPSTLASILPGSRAVSASGGAATAFATVLNPTTTAFTGCDIAPFASLPATFLFQTTDPATNAPTGAPNTRVNIAANSFQTFVIAFTPSGPFASTEVEFAFACDGVVPASVIPGVNTLTLSAASVPGPDIVALAASAPPGRVILASAGAFAVATANVGSAGIVSVSADTGGAVLPMALSWCQTDPLLGTCMGSPSTQPFDVTIGAGGTPTFAVFAAASAPIAFDPAANRIFFRIRDQAGQVIGATSVAASTP